MSAIKNLARDLWYRSPGKDRHMSRKISAELYRFEQIEKAAQALIDYRRRAGPLGFQLEKADDFINELKKALKPLKEE